MAESKINELINHGKQSGKLTTKEITDVLEELDFDAEEITGRFVRGDKARASDGNGLGLAIAKSYTEVCGGKFDVIIDGDLFKVVISFEKN